MSLEAWGDETPFETITEERVDEAFTSHGTHCGKVPTHGRTTFTTPHASHRAK